MKQSDYTIQILPSGVENPLFQQRESGVRHSPYAMETAFYSLIKRGESESVSEEIGKLFAGTGHLVVGRLSDNALRQMQYFAVSCITLAVRAAIEGGLEESTAYNLSDECVQRVDRAKEPSEIAEFLAKKATELATLVRCSRQKSGYPESIKICVGYIDKHLHSKITAEELAKECGLSRDYLCSLFKKTTGENISAYIVGRKLSAAKDLLAAKVDSSGMGYYFSFCSESYFISCFKKKYGMTPKEYVKSLNY